MEEFTIYSKFVCVRVSEIMYDSLVGLHYVECDFVNYDNGIDYSNEEFNRVKNLRVYEPFDEGFIGDLKLGEIYTLCLEYYDDIGFICRLV